MGALFGVTLAAVWLTWFFGASVSLFVLSETARIEIDRNVSPVQTSVAGRVVATRLEVGREVVAGEALVEIDAEAERRQRDEARARIQGLDRQADVLRREISGESRTQQDDQLVAGAAVETARARLAEAESEVRFAVEQERRLDALHGQGLISELELLRARADVEKRRAAADALGSEVRRLESERRTRAGEGGVRVEQLSRQLAEIETSRQEAVATVARLSEAIDRCRVLAPVTGRIGEAASLQVGAFVAEGASLGTIVPTGGRRLVGEFAPPSALGRIEPGQMARLRLDGFPWAEYGVVTARVANVATEPRDGLVRVELDVLPDANSRIPLQHGLSGTVEVEVERVSPAVLVMRSIGGFFKGRR